VTRSLSQREPPSLQVDKDGAELVYRDRRRSLRAVRFVSDISRLVRPTDFRRVGPATWRLRIPRPPVDRLEYQLELEHETGAGETISDPANPRRARGPFGESSVLEFPGYAPPSWTTEEAPPGSIVELVVPSRELRTDVSIAVWSSGGAEPERPSPLLLVHDGPETAEYTRLPHLLAHLVATGALPPLRAALLAPPGNRDDVYSASAGYSRALAREVLPALRDAAPTPLRREALIGVGASLGALALLHVHRRYSDAVGGLFLQSGSFFRRDSAPHMVGFPHFGRISRFVGNVLRGTDRPAPVDVVMTCGIAEGNLACNRAMAEALRRQGYPVRFVELRDAHNWTAWRDAYDPWLVELLQHKWG
jgi:enterochelin esterase family protein